MKTLIEATHLKFNYGQKSVLKDISFRVNSGEIIGLIGENGAGKTTLLNILLGLYPTTGDVVLFGKQPGSKVGKAHIGSMLQTDMVIQGVTVSELLAEIASCYETSFSPEQLIKELHLTTFAKERLTNLSGGQLRQVTFAIALIGNPDLLFLDEPTVGMDVQARQSFWHRIRLLKQQGKTIVITSHYLNEIQEVADRILVMKNGQFIFQGSFNDLQNQHQRVEIVFQTERASDVLKVLPHVTEINKSDGNIHIRSTDGDATLYALMKNFKHLHQITVTRESLETIFVQLTNQEVK